MDNQKDINKEVLKSDEEKVEDLAKDAEDLEKAVEKDIKDKVEKAEEVNDAKAEPIKSDIAASKKEFKDEQERDSEVVPGLEKAELEEGLNEAKKTLDDVYEDPGLESIWETNWKELVPAKGKAETPIGEVMRCFAKVSHEYFQNGSILGKGWNNKSNYDAANDMDRALQANGLNDNELCKLWDKIWATRSEAAYDHYLAEFYEKFINKYLKNSTVSEGLKEAKGNPNADKAYKKLKEISVKPFTEKLELNEAEDYESSDDLDEGIFGPKITSCLVYKGVGGLHCDYITDKGSRDDLKLKLKQVQDAGNYTNIQTMTYDSAKQLFKKSGKNIKQYLGKQLDGIADKAKAAQAKQDARDNADRDAAAKEGELQRKYAAQQKADREASRRAEKQSVDRYTSGLVARDKARNPGYQSSGFHWSESLGEDLEESLKEGKEDIKDDSYYVLRTGGSFEDYSGPFDSFEEAKTYAADHRKMLAQGENKYYRKGYKGRPYTVIPGSKLKKEINGSYLKDESLKETLENGTIDTRETEILDKAISTVRYDYLGGDDKAFANIAISDWGMTPEELDIFCGVDANNTNESLKEDSNKVEKTYVVNFENISGESDSRLVNASSKKEAANKVKTAFGDNYKRLEWVGEYDPDEDEDGPEDIWLEDGKDEPLKEAVSQDLINAIMWFNGCSKTAAIKQARSMDEERKKALIDAFKSNAKKSFYSESLKEDLMDSSWGSDFRSDVYNALSDVAFKYYRKDISITDDDWNEAIEWFMTHFFESDDNPFYESLKEDIELWDSDRVVDLARYYAKKYPDALDEQIIKAIIKTMQKQGATLPSDLKEVEKIYYATIDEDNDYDAEYGEPYDESLDEAFSDLSPIAQKAIKALHQLERPRMDKYGNKYYAPLGYKGERNNPYLNKDYLGNSEIDWQKANFTKVSAEDALGLYRQDPRNILVVVGGRAILFDSEGNKIGRNEGVRHPVIKRDGSELRDTERMTIKQLLSIADEIYSTDYYKTLRDPEMLKDRGENPESPNYEGPSARELRRQVYAGETDYWGDPSESDKKNFYRKPNAWNWPKANENDLRRYKSALKDYEAELRDRNLSATRRADIIYNIEWTEDKIKRLEKDKQRYNSLVQNYKATLRNTTQLKHIVDQRIELVKIKKEAEEAEKKLQAAQIELDNTKKGTYEYRNKKRALNDVESSISYYKNEIEKLIARAEDYKKQLADIEASGANDELTAKAQAKYDQIAQETSAAVERWATIKNRLKQVTPTNESLEEDLTITKSFATYEPWGQAVDTFERIKKADKLEEAESILEELYPEGITETSLNDILAFEPEWLLNELGIADDEEKAMLEL